MAVENPTNEQVYPLNSPLKTRVIEALDMIRGNYSRRNALLTNLPIALLIMAFAGCGNSDTSAQQIMPSTQTSSSKPATHATIATNVGCLASPLSFKAGEIELTNADSTSLPAVVNASTDEHVPSF